MTHHPSFRIPRFQHNSRLGDEQLSGSCLSRPRDTRSGMRVLRAGVSAQAPHPRRNACGVRGRRAVSSRLPEIEHRLSETRGSTVGSERCDTEAISHKCLIVFLVELSD